MTETIRGFFENSVVQVLGAGKWVTGTFCSHCSAKYHHTDVCPQCGERSSPELRVYREVITGHPWKLWTRRRAVEFKGDEVRGSVALTKTA